MRPKTPTLEQLASIADEYRLHLSEGELDQFRALMPTTLGSYERIDQLEQPLPNVRYLGSLDTGRHPQKIPWARGTGVAQSKELTQAR